MYLSICQSLSLSLYLAIYLSVLVQFHVRFHAVKVPRFGGFPLGNPARGSSTGSLFVQVRFGGVLSRTLQILAVVECDAKSLAIATFLCIFYAALIEAFFVCPEIRAFTGFGARFLRQIPKSKKYYSNTRMAVDNR